MEPTMPMTLDAFRASLARDEPPANVTAPLAALWWAGREGGWERAHALVQAASGAEAAWVHAYLHRAEGDLGNAGYWYARAGRQPAEESLEAEREAIAAALLAA